MGRLTDHALVIGAERRRLGIHKNPRDANPFTSGTDLYDRFMEGWHDEDRRLRISKKRRLVELQKMFRGPECPACGHHKPPSLYLCRECWPKLPDRTKRVLERRDRFALARLFDLMDAIVRRVPLDQITVADNRQDAEMIESKETAKSDTDKQGVLL